MKDLLSNLEINLENNTLKLNYIDLLCQEISNDLEEISNTEITQPQEMYKMYDVKRMAENNLIKISLVLDLIHEAKNINDKSISQVLESE